MCVSLTTRHAWNDGKLQAIIFEANIYTVDDTWKKISQIVERCWNYIKVDPHIFPRIWLDVHSDLLNLTKVHPFCRAAHLPTYRKCMEMLGVGGIVKAFSTNFELTANGSTCINSNGIFFPVAYSANCEESYLIIVSRFSNIHWIFLEFALADRCILATQAQPVVSDQAQWLVMCHNVPQQLAVYLK